MDEILEAVRIIRLAIFSGDPDVVALLITARASCGIRVSGKPNILCSTQTEILRAEIRFEHLFQNVLRNHSPASLG